MSRAAAERWFAGNVGRLIDTVQERPAGGQPWRPGPRWLMQKGRRFFLDGSKVGLDADTRVQVTGDAVVLSWYGADGELIHTTTYRVVTADYRMEKAS